MCSSLTHYSIVNSLCGNWEWGLWTFCSSMLVCTCCCFWWWVSYALCYCHTFFILSFALSTVFCYDSYISLVLFLCCTRHCTFTFLITIIKEGVVFLGHFTIVLWYVDLTFNLLIALVIMEVGFENQYSTGFDCKGYVDVCALFHLCDVISLCVCSSVSVLELRIFC